MRMHSGTGYIVIQGVPQIWSPFVHNTPFILLEYSAGFRFWEGEKLVLFWLTTTKTKSIFIMLYLLLVNRTKTN